MNKKLRLTEQQHILIINEILSETVKKMESNERLDENFWDSVKYGLSKLGRYKAGGKIFGKGKIDQESMAKIKAILDKEGNELIRALDAKIREENPEFPNNKDPQQFLTTVMEIAAVYDSVVGGTQKQADTEGYIPIDAANSIIGDLREYTKKYLDVDLAAVYSGFDENENLMNEEYELNSEQQKKLDENFGLREVEPEAAPAPANPDLDAGDVRSQLQAKRGGGEDFSSTRMDTLKSNKLPMILAGAGAALGSLGWMAQTEWFKHWIESIIGADKVLQTPAITQDITGGAPDKEGFVHWISDIGGKPIQTGADMQQFINKFGAENVSHMFDANGGGDSMGQMQKLQQLINSNPQASMGDLFNKADQTFGSMQGGQNLFGVSSSAKFFATIVVKQATSTIVKGAGTAVASQLAGLGPIVAGIGVGLILTGALVKLVRMKGQKSSRAATLNALFQSMRGLDGGMGLVPVPGVADASGEAPTDDVGAGAGDIGGAGAPVAGAPVAGPEAGKKATDTGAQNEDLYNGLKNLFQFIVNNKKTMGSKSEFGTGTSGKPAQAPLTEGKYIKDKRVLQYLSKSLPFDKVKNFESLLTRVEYLRNVLKKMGGASTDKQLNNFLAQLDKNPIMLTNFAELTNVDPNNAQEVNSLLAFIKETLLAVYTKDYKVDNMVDKMGTLGGGNINKLSEEAGYSAAEPNKAFMKDANSRTTFKKNLASFLSTAMGIFQYLHKTKGGNIARKDTSNKYTAPQRTAPKPQAPAQGPTNQKTGQTALFESEDLKLMEEIKRIRKIMLG